MLQLARHLKQDSDAVSEDLEHLIDQCKDLLDTLEEGPSGSMQEENKHDDSTPAGFLSQITDIIEQNMGNEDFGIQELCEAAGLSRTHLHRKIKSSTGLSVSLYIRQLRLERAKYLLETTDLSVSQITYTVGFNNPEYFSRKFSQAFGLPPSAFAAQAKE